MSTSSQERLSAIVEGFEMSFSMNLYYSGENGNAKAFAEEMISSGIVEKIKQIDGCLRYEYFTSFEHPETILLIDTWREQRALDEYHSSPIMGEVAKLREKYDLHMKAERYIRDDVPDEDSSFIRK